MQCSVQNKRKILLGSADPLSLSDQQEAAEDNMCRNTVPMKMTREGGENSATHLWTDYFNDATIEEY